MGGAPRRGLPAVPAGAVPGLETAGNSAVNKEF